MKILESRIMTLENQHQRVRIEQPESIPEVLLPAEPDFPENKQPKEFASLCHFLNSWEETLS